VPADLIRLALAQMKANLRRCGLALASVALGVGVLISLGDLGRLTELKTTASLSKLGLADVIRVETAPGDERFLTPRTAAELKWRFNFVSAAAAEAELSRAAARWGKEEELRALVLGVGPGFFSIMNLDLAQGRRLTSADRAEPVAVVGWRLARRMGERRHILVQGQPHRVIGVVASNPWRESGQAVFLPLEAAERRLGQFISKRRLRVKVDDLARLEPALAALESYFLGLGVRRGGRERGQIEPGLAVRANRKAADQVRWTVSLLKTFLRVVGLTTLVLGGLGIGNTLLASTAERLREIGIRKAVGASGGDIFWQFLAEAFTLGLSGGLVGVMLGLGLVAGISRFMPQTPLSLNLGSAGAALGLAVGVGLIFSLQPVFKASRRDVVQALRGF